MKKKLLIGTAVFGTVALCGIAVRKAIKDFKAITKAEETEEQE